MRLWWTTACYELIKYSRMRSVLIILIALPLVLILLLGSAFDTHIKPAKVALHVADRGQMRESIDLFWKDEAITPYIHVLVTDSEKEVQDWVSEGIADYGIYVPESFSEKLLAGEMAKWHTFSGRYGEKNMVAEAVVDRYMANVNLNLAAVATFGPNYKPVNEKSGSAMVSGESFLTIGTLDAGDNQVFGKATSMQYYSVAYLIMFLLYGGMSAALALLDQKENGTLQRLYAIPVSFRISVFGIIVGSVLLAALQAIIIIAFTASVYGVEWGRHFGWIMLICLLTVAAGVGLAITIASFAGTSKTTQTLFSILIFTMTFLSGGMIAGIESMIGDVSKWTINYWANSGLRAIMSGNDSLAIWNNIGMLALISIILTIIGIIRLPKVVKQHG